MLKINIKQIDYSDDPSFQTQGVIFLDAFFNLFENKDNTEFAKANEGLKDDFKWLIPLFKNKCDPTRKWNQDYKLFMNLFFTNQCKLKPAVTRKRDNLIKQATLLKKQLEKNVADNTQVTESLLYNLSINCSLMAISEVTHKSLLGSLSPSTNGFTCILDPSTITLSNFQSFLSHWLNLKELYVVPSLEIIEKLYKEDRLLNPQSIHYSEPVLLDWLAVFERDISLLFAWTYNQNKIINQVKFLKEIRTFLLQIDPMIDYSIQSAARIIQLIKISNQVSKRELNTHQLNYFNQLTDKSFILIKKIKLLKENIKSANAKAQKNANELILTEEQEKALRKQKKQRTYRFLQEKHAELFYSDSEEKEDEEIVEEQAIEPEFTNLEILDFKSYDLAKKLMVKVVSFKNDLQMRSRRKVAILSDEQQKILLLIGALLTDYDELFNLCEQHKKLSQLPEILAKEELQEGIQSNQADRFSACKVIYDDINQILRIYEELITQKKKSRKDYIAKIGYDEFVRIGEEKINNNQEFSQYTKEREFLKLIKLALTGLNRVQNQIKNHLFDKDNPNQTNPKYEKISYGRYQGMLGFFHRMQYENNNDISCRDKALSHNKAALSFYKKVNNKPVVAYFSASIETLEADKQENALEKTSLGF